MTGISKHLEREATATIVDLHKTNENEKEIKDTPGFVVIRHNKLPDNNLVILKNIVFKGCKYAVCQDRR